MKLSTIKIQAQATTTRTISILKLKSLLPPSTQNLQSKSMLATQPAQVTTTTTTVSSDTT
jgi:hypothetical protein